MLQKLYFGCTAYLMLSDFAIGQDGAAIVRALGDHAGDYHRVQCVACESRGKARGDHTWQTIDRSANCGSAPCTYKDSWCAKEDGALTCVPLSPACQDFLPGPGQTIGTDTTIGTGTATTLAPTIGTTLTAASPVFETTMFPRFNAPLLTQAPVGLTQAPIQPVPSITQKPSGLITLFCGGCQCDCSCGMAPPCPPPPPPLCGPAPCGGGQPQYKQPQPAIVCGSPPCGGGQPQYKQPQPQPAIGPMCSSPICGGGNWQYKQGVQPKPGKYPGNVAAGAVSGMTPATTGGMPGTAQSMPGAARGMPGTAGSMPGTTGNMPAGITAGTPKNITAGNNSMAGTPKNMTAGNNSTAGTPRNMTAGNMPGTTGNMTAGSAGLRQLADPILMNSVTSCSDYHPRCEAWANRGECVVNPRYMFRICQSSCGGCRFRVL